ncbi:MAG: hypothetical protein QF599_06045 [Planctomycetota bacterium]|jgi:hypothetical protein|nr:hypothetical protein [Planctomycetota bacterium]MDP6518370.1 hypothetical protein [Planctomycetota bacterium]MDP6955519.1 hypothetical protein [Planctomycetota bacterium]
MTNKDLEVRCPCCDTSITVDPLTGRILRAVEPDQRDETGKPVVDGERWDRVSEGVAERPAKAEDKLEAGLRREANRERSLDDLFQKAKDKVKRRGEGELPGDPQQ